MDKPQKEYVEALQRSKDRNLGDKERQDAQRAKKKAAEEMFQGANDRDERQTVKKFIAEASQGKHQSSRTTSARTSSSS